MTDTTPAPAEALSNYKRSMSDTNFNLALQDALGMAYQAVGCVETGEVGWGSEADRTMATLGAAYAATLARAQAAEAERDRLREREAGLREVMDEHFPEWNEDRDQQEFEECVWQSDRAHEAALPAICAIRAVLASTGGEE